MASVILVFFLLVCAAAAVDNKSSGSGFDLDMIEEKIGGFLPTGFSAFGALVAIKIKKILLVLTFLLGTALATKLFSGLWPLMGFGHHHCPYKPVYFREEEYEKPYFSKEYDTLESPHYGDHYGRSAQSDFVMEKILAAVQQSFKIMENVTEDRATGLQWGHGGQGGHGGHDRQERRRSHVSQRR